MKTPLFGLLFFVAVLAHAQPLKIMTYNIRYDNPADGENSWPARKAWLSEQIRSEAPGIFCIQEGLVQQVRYLDDAFAAYRHIGVGREDGKTKGEFSAVWFEKSRFRLIKSGTFWLSPTPSKVSVGWDAALERICTWGLFRDRKEGTAFWVFNTHFDHMGEMARKNSALLIIQKMKEFNTAGYPVILCGDLNAEPESEPIRILSGYLRDARVADKSMQMGPDGTFNGFDTTKAATARIDYIMAGKGAQPSTYHVIRETKEGRYASDHFPVVAEIMLSSE
jgi:endonuclease/exonuclease/phosphatase family metal-dependent hydrolase